MEKVISKNLITAIPGIGSKYAQRLNAVGIKKPDDLLKQFERLNKDPQRFISWMKNQCQATAGHAKKTSDVVKGLFFDENQSSRRENGDGCKKYNILTPKSLLKSTNGTKMDLQPPKIPLTASKSKVHHQHSNSATKSSATGNEDNDGAKDALNQHLSKLRGQFSDMHDSANQKMLELQSELGKMQHMSHEFDVLAEFLTSEKKLSIFEQNLDRLQKTVCLTEDKIHEINTNNQKMGRMIRQINGTAKRQLDNNERAIVAIGERLERWESKLDRVTRKITNQKINVNDAKVNKTGDLGQLKDDIEHVLNRRLVEVSNDIGNMKSVVICIISLIILKMFVFDLFKDVKMTQLTTVEE